jgi:hypothetical protein
MRLSKQREHQQRLEMTLPPTDHLFLQVVAVKSRCPGMKVRTRVSLSESSKPRRVILFLNIHVFSFPVNGSYNGFAKRLKISFWAYEFMSQSDCETITLYNWRESDEDFENLQLTSVNHCCSSS